MSWLRKGSIVLDGGRGGSVRVDVDSHSQGPKTMRGIMHRGHGTHGGKISSVVLVDGMGRRAWDQGGREVSSRHMGTICGHVSRTQGWGEKSGSVGSVGHALAGPTRRCMTHMVMFQYFMDMLVSQERLQREEHEALMDKMEKVHYLQCPRNNYGDLVWFEFVDRENQKGGSLPCLL